MSILREILFSNSLPYTQYIRTQHQFDNINYQENDNILFLGSFTGTIKEVDKDNVTFNQFNANGSSEITGWTDEGSGVYSKVMNEPKWLYVEGQDIKLCRTGNFVVQSIPSQNQIEITSTSFDLTNSKLVGFPTVFNLSREFTVIDHTGNIVTLDRNHNFNGTTNIGTPEEVWFLNNKDFFDDEFQWSYEGGKVYLKTPMNPSNYFVKSVDYDYAISVKANNFTLKNSNIKEYFNASVSANNSNSDIKILNTNISYIREDGIRSLSENNGFEVIGCDIANCGASGMIFSNTTGVRAIKNNIYNIGTQSNYGWIKTDIDVDPYRNSTVGGGIFVVVNAEILSSPYANDFLVQENDIYNCAYNAISTHAAYNGLITKNKAHGVLKRFEDGGAIYTYFYKPAYPQLAENIEISYNFIWDIPSGWSNSGIYQDNRSGNNHIHHNVVYDCDGEYAVWCNQGTTGQNFHDNTFIGGTICTFRDVYFGDGTTPNTTNVDVNNNIFLQTNNVDIIKLGGNIYGSADNNYYINPYYSKVYNDGDLASLQSAFGQDLNSTEITDYIATPPDPDNEILIIPNPSDSVLVGTAPSGVWEDVNGNVVTNYSVLGWESLLLLKK